MAFEIVEQECQLQFLRPTQTRWSSLFLAVERVAHIQKEQGEAAIRNVCTALKIKMFTPAEFGFLAEYTAVMKPVAMTLNILQGEKLDLTCKVCRPLVTALLNGFQKRFGDAMVEPELIAAAILLPKFRTFWTAKEHILKADTDNDDDSTDSSHSDEDDFFASMRSGIPQAGERERYLSCPSSESMDLLHTFPHIKKLSLKINTGLPASAACERLFSHAGLLFTAKCSQQES
ncbi:hypothetical protein WMY93_025538 [Mugilogobius chulae]|uniref:HAT C-terminal dimerisation domain-containing protein n=1 Tax=Mugilogobius chulae TaxID=88201 RepID=A0AAW0MUZ0_9GOBI